MKPKGGLLAVYLPDDLGFAGSRYGSLSRASAWRRARAAHSPGCRGHLRIYTRPRQHVAFGLLTQQSLKLFIVSAEGMHCQV